eukprot:748844-Hanusia_phi.AAC.2
MPDEHVAGLRSELNHVLSELGQVSFLKVDKHLILADVLVQVGPAEVDGSSVVGGCLVQGHPEPQGIKLAAMSRGQRSVLVVLVPLEALVGVDHEEVGGDADLVESPARGASVTS